jgi:transposase
MRGAFVDQGGLFSYISPEARVPPNHPLRKIRALVRDVLGELNRSFARLYSSEGRPSIAPEQLLSALLLQVLYGIRSERQLMEQLDDNLLYLSCCRFDGHRDWVFHEAGGCHAETEIQPGV